MGKGDAWVSSVRGGREKGESKSGWGERGGGRETTVVAWGRWMQGSGRL